MRSQESYPVSKKAACLIKNIEMTDIAYHESEIQEREHARWVAYQKEGIAPEEIIQKERDWAKSSLKSSLSNWQTCVFYAVCGGLLTGVSALILFLMHDSMAAVICCVLGLIGGISAISLFAKQAFRKPVIHKSRSWLLAEQQLSTGKQ
jgi:hypothetical protein